MYVSMCIWMNIQPMPTMFELGTHVHYMGAGNMLNTLHCLVLWQEKQIKCDRKCFSLLQNSIHTVHRIE